MPLPFVGHIFPRSSLQSCFVLVLKFELHPREPWNAKAKTIRNSRSHVLIVSQPETLHSTGLACKHNFTDLLTCWKDGYQIRIVQSQFKELVDSIGGKARDERDFPIEALEGEFSSREDGKVFVWHEATQSPINFKRENCHLPNHFTSSQLG